MKKILLSLIAIALCVFSLSACSSIADVESLINRFDPDANEATEAQLIICNGYVVKTTHGYFFVSTEDCGALKKEDFLKMNPYDETVDFSAYQTGDKVEIGFYTVEEIYPLQATVYKFTYKIGRYVFEEMSMSVFEKLEDLGYEIVLRDSDLVRPWEAGVGYGIYLPISNQTVKIEKKYERYLNIIDDEMVRDAEKKLLGKVDSGSDTYDLYLDTDNMGCLCLTIEIIRKVDAGDDAPIDHEHIVFKERITR